MARAILGRMMRRRLVSIAALLFIALVHSAAFAAELTVHFFDVGQGDAMLITSPAGKTVLIDAGTPDSGAKLQRRLKELVAGPIDLALLTHPHADHLGGMERVLKSIGARIFMEPGFNHPSAGYAKLLSAVEAKGIPLRLGEAGRNVELGGGASLRLLAPGKPMLRGTRSDANANSIVARLTYGSTAFYFAGDSESETERAVLASGEEIKSSVYKVAHHASRHSSSAELLRRIAPQVAIVSVGAGNSYGHPTRATLDRLEDVGAQVFRTDLDGEVVVVSDGKTVLVRTEKGAGLSSKGFLSAGEPIRKAAPASPHRERPPARPAVVRKTGRKTDQPAPPVEAVRANARTEPVAPAAIKPAAPREPESQAVWKGPWVASRNSQVFHVPDCKNAAKIKPDNLITYQVRAEAVNSGRRPAMDCNP